MVDAIGRWSGRRRKQPESEEQNREDGKPAPHLGFMLHEDRLAWDELEAGRIKGAARSRIIGLFSVSIRGMRRKAGV
jgi:hypothetical protein